MEKIYRLMVVALLCSLITSCDPVTFIVFTNNSNAVLKVDVDNVSIGEKQEKILKPNDSFDVYIMGWWANTEDELKRKFEMGKMIFSVFNLDNNTKLEGMKAIEISLKKIIHDEKNKNTWYIKLNDLMPYME